MFKLLFILSATAASCLAQGSIITTVAGTDFLFPRGPIAGTSAPLGQIRAVLADGKGSLYISDATNCLVTKASTSSAILSVVAGNGICGLSGDGGPAVSASLNPGAGLALDSAGNLYISEEGNSRVRRVDTSGNITTVASGLKSPQGIALDSLGNLYIADAGNNRIRRVTPQGVSTVYAGNGIAGFSGDNNLATAASLNFPVGVAVDSGGNLLISDTGNSRIRRVTPQGIIQPYAGNGTATCPGAGGLPTSTIPVPLPGGIALDTGGNLYVAVESCHIIERVTPNGAATNVFAGTSGKSGFGGDGTSATSQSTLLDSPAGVAVDSTGVYIADTNNLRVRSVATSGFTASIIATFAGSGTSNFSGDGGPATLANLLTPSSVAFDPFGNFYIADQGNLRVRRVDSRGIITTYAGNGARGTTNAGDGGPAVNAPLSNVNHIVTDSQGTLFIADGPYVRRVSTSGIISTIAGGGQSLAENVLATTARINATTIAFDLSGNLYIGDFATNRVRRVSPQGIITTVAGTGAAVNFGTGDGGPATAAAFVGTNGLGLAIDSFNTIYVSDPADFRVRRFTVGGTIRTFAGGGTIQGDGGLATSAVVQPFGLALDAFGNLSIADAFNHSIRRVSAGIIGTIAGSQTQVAGFAGDGGAATQALLNRPVGIALDAAGTTLIADYNNNRVRRLVTGLPNVTANPTQITATGIAGGPSLPIRTVQLTTTGIAGQSFTVTANQPWLSVSPSSGTIPATIAITINPSTLTSVGTFTGAITVSVPALGQTLNIPVTLSTTSQSTRQLSVDATSLTFALIPAGPSGAATVTLSGDAALSFTASATTTNGGPWLRVTPTNGGVTPNTPVPLTVIATPGSLAAGTYQGRITITGPNSNQTFLIAVTMTVGTPRPVVEVTQTGLSFTAVSGVNFALSQRFSFLNSGSGTMPYAVSSTTTTGARWLNVTNASGIINRPLTELVNVDVGVSTASLAPGTYFGRVQVDSSTAANRSKSVIVVLTVLPSNANPAPDIRPSGVAFTGFAGQSPGSKSVAVSNLANKQLTLGSSVSYTGQVGGWISVQPSDISIGSGASQSIQIQPNFAKLTAPGAYRAIVTLRFDDGSFRPITVLAIVGRTDTLANGASLDGQAGDVDRSAVANCTPSNLFVNARQVPFSGGGIATFPGVISAEVFDDCTNPITDRPARVRAQFTPGVTLDLSPDGTGLWTGTWTPTGTAANTVLKLTADLSPLRSDTFEAPVLSLVAGPDSAPQLTNAPLRAATLTEGPFAIGDLMLLRGIRFTKSTTAATSPIPQTTLNNTFVLLNGVQLRLLYVDQTRIVAQIPLDATLPFNAQIIVSNNDLGTDTFSRDVIISAVNPSVFARDANAGQGQSLVYKMNTAGNAGVLADANNPALPGDTLIIYATGLGAVDGAGLAAKLQEFTIMETKTTVSYAGLARPGNYPTGGAPRVLDLVATSPEAGLYQINATVPANIAVSPDPSFAAAGSAASGNFATGTVPIVIISDGSRSEPQTQPDGQRTIVVSTTVAAPVISSFTATSSTITVGQSSTLAWTVTGADSVSIDQGIGSVLATSTRTVSPATTTTYTITARKAGLASVTRAVTVTVNPVVNLNRPFIGAGGVVTAAGSTLQITPLGLASIFGARFTTGSAQNWDGANLRTTLNGVSVTIDGRPAFPIFVGPDFINVQVPDATTRGMVDVTVTNAVGTSDPVRVLLSDRAPEFKSWGASPYVEATRDGCPNPACNVAPPGTAGLGSATPARPGENINLWALGFGASNPAILAGTIAGVPQRVPVTVTITIGGTPAVSQFGMFLLGVGLYQINIQVPNLPDGEYPVVATVGEQPLLTRKDGVALRLAIKR